MSRWYVSVGMSLSIDYDDIEADTKEEAEEIAKTRASEDIDYNNCDCEVDNMSVWSSFKEETNEQCKCKIRNKSVCMRKIFSQTG